MPWYYANNNQRLGPVSDTEFARLAREKVIHGDTLVWQHGMADWKTFSEVEPTLPAVEVPPPIPQEASGAGDIDVAAILASQPVSLDYAGFWVRGAAKLIDWSILYAVSQLLAHAMGLGKLDPFAVLEMSQAEVQPLFQRVLMLALLDGAVRLVFYWYFLKRFAATPGKMIFGLQVVSTRGDSLANGQIVRRYFSEILAKYFTLGIGYIVAAFDPEKRAMQDHFCDTRVIRRRR